MYAPHGLVLTGCPQPQTALTVILLGFNNGRARRMALLAYARRVTTPSRCGAVLWGLRTDGRRRGYRTKASGRGWCVPRRRLAPALR